MGIKLGGLADLQARSQINFHHQLTINNNVCMSILGVHHLCMYMVKCVGEVRKCIFWVLYVHCVLCLQHYVYSCVGLKVHVYVCVTYVV